MNSSESGIFQHVKALPDPEVKRRFAALIGLDEIKGRLLKEAQLLIEPTALEDWSRKFHGGVLPAVRAFFDRPPLFLFTGDVGTGKTALAETFGDSLARSMNIPLTLYALSLNARGTGAVGEMSSLLSAAFAKIGAEAKKGVGKGKRSLSAVILLIDEADAFAQSREFSQMHHEDRAGVNALIRGVDTLATGKLPAIVIMCTNRIDSIDPAVKRRASVIFKFERPSEGQRVSVLRDAFDGVGFTTEQIQALAKATGRNAQRPYGCTYSDLVQRFIPSLILNSFPEGPLRFDRAISFSSSFQPTAPFKEEMPS
ncbi:MAG: ATP-binding protein [Nitrospirae bacterium]|nr:ATP-binding protein [Nitrospirota bacterium]